MAITHTCLRISEGRERGAASDDVAPCLHARDRGGRWFIITTSVTMRADGAQSCLYGYCMAPRMSRSRMRHATLPQAGLLSVTLASMAAPPGALPAGRARGEAPKPDGDNARRPSTTLRASNSS